MTPDSQTLAPLPEVLSHGLIAVATFGLLSFFCSSSLFLYLTYRIIKWQRDSESKAPINQFLFLIYNLLLADIKQALAFALNTNALRQNAIEIGTPICWAQGWFVSTGDLASSAFICAIACHTFLGVVKDYRLPTNVFYGVVCAIWAFVYLLAALGPLMHHEDFYARASAWCWISEEYQDERLWLHYFWLFVFMFSTVLIYAIIFTCLRLRICSNPGASSESTHSTLRLMILYPLIYVVCTAPLAAGRIAGLAGHDASLAFFCVSGSMIACNGVLDVIIYASTRADIVFTEHPPGEDVGLDTFAFMGKGHRFGTTTTVEAGERGRRLKFAKRSHRDDSLENLYGLDRIGVKGEVTVTVDTRPHGFVRRDRIASGSGASGGSEDEISRISTAIER